MISINVNEQSKAVERRRERGHQRNCRKAISREEMGHFFSPRRAAVTVVAVAAVDDRPFTTEHDDLFPIELVPFFASRN